MPDDLVTGFGEFLKSQQPDPLIAGFGEFLKQQQGHEETRKANLARNIQLNQQIEQEKNQPQSGFEGMMRSLSGEEVPGQQYTLHGVDTQPRITTPKPWWGKTLDTIAGTGASLATMPFLISRNLGETGANAIYGISQRKKALQILDKAYAGLDPLVSGLPPIALAREAVEKTPIQAIINDPVNAVFTALMLSTASPKVREGIRETFPTIFTPQKMTEVKTAPASPMEVTQEPNGTFSVKKVTGETLESGFKDAGKASKRMKDIEKEQTIPKTKPTVSERKPPVVPIAPTEKQKVPETPKALPFPQAKSFPQTEEFPKTIKQPWEMTSDEFHKNYDEGKTIPPEILKDYPDLIKPKPKVPAGMGKKPTYRKFDLTQPKTIYDAIKKLGGLNSKSFGGHDLEDAIGDDKFIMNPKGKLFEDTAHEEINQVLTNWHIRSPDELRELISTGAWKEPLPQYYKNIEIPTREGDTVFAKSDKNMTDPKVTKSINLKKGTIRLVDGEPVTIPIGDFIKKYEVVNEFDPDNLPPEVKEKKEDLQPSSEEIATEQTTVPGLEKSTLTKRGYQKGIRQDYKTLKDYGTNNPLFDKGESGKIINPAQLMGVDEFVKQDVIPGIKNTFDVINEGKDTILKGFSPVSRGTGAKPTAYIMRENLAELARKRNIAEKAFETAKIQFDRMPKETNLGFIDDIEHKRINQMTDPGLKLIAQQLREILDNRRQAVQDLGTGKLEHFIEDYFPHIWKDPEKARDILRSIYGKKPLAGPAYFLRQRTLPYTRDGINRGLEPVSYNPIELTLAKVYEMDRYIMGQQVFQEMKDTGLARFFKHPNLAPPGWAQIPDKIARVLVPVEKYGRYVTTEDYQESMRESTNVLKETITEAGRGESTEPVTKVEGKAMEALRARGWSEGEAQQILDRIKKAPTNEAKDRLIERVVEKTVFKTAERSKTTEFKAGKGFVETGKYYAPEPAVKILQNYLDPGFQRYKTFRGFRYLGNLQLQTRLGYSGFHLGFTALDSAISRMALGLRETGTPGFRLRGLKDIARGVQPLSIISEPLSNYIKSSKMLKEYYAPGSIGGEVGQIVDSLIKGGGTVKMDSFYRNSAVESFLKAWRSGNKPGAVLRAYSALTEFCMIPTMEWAVPRMKLGVFFDIAQFELDKMIQAGKSPSVMELRDVMGKAWDSTENRMGQLRYDNLFWNKTFKDLAMLSVQSLGWNLGTVREIGGGLADLARGRLSNKAGYVIALPIIVGTYGAIYQYLMTGKGPQELKDYYYPKTGKLNRDGTPERVSFPSYMRDIYPGASRLATGDVPGFLKEVKTQAQHKVHPTFQNIIEMLGNRDYYNTEIRNLHDPFMRQVIDEVKYLIGSNEPYFYQNYKKRAELGEPWYKSGQSTIGIVPAPTFIDKSDAQLLLSEYSQGLRPQAARTKEQYDKAQAKRLLQEEMMGNKLTAEQRKQLSARLTPTERERVITQGRKGSYYNQIFNELPYDKAISVYLVSTPEEKKRYKQILKSRLYREADRDPEKYKVDRAMYNQSVQ